MAKFICSILTGENVSQHAAACEPYKSIAADIAAGSSFFEIERIYADGDTDPNAIDGQVVIVIQAREGTNPRGACRRAISQHAPEAIYTVTELL